MDLGKKDPRLAINVRSQSSYTMVARFAPKPGDPTFSAVGNGRSLWPFTIRYHPGLAGPERSGLFFRPARIAARNAPDIDVVALGKEHRCNQGALGLA